MHLQERIDLLVELGIHMRSADPDWITARQKAFQENNWFIPEFIELSIDNICREFLDAEKLKTWADQYPISKEVLHPKNVGLVMAGNLPLVGFHDFLCTFLSGHCQTVKASSKDEALIRQLADHLFRMNKDCRNYISFAAMLKGCDAYIATGSNNSARYFEYYFSAYPHIIRRNRTSVAILTGKEGSGDLEKLADDVFQYFGLGCRNVTKIYAPADYDFVPLLESFNKYDWLANHHKYKNNYDYQLAILLLNKKYYMTNGVVLIAEAQSPFSPIGVLHLEYYTDPGDISKSLQGKEDIQCVVGQGYTAFGEAQRPKLGDFADGIDTLQFLQNL